MANRSSLYSALLGVASVALGFLSLTVVSGVERIGGFAGAFALLMAYYAKNERGGKTLMVAGIVLGIAGLAINVSAVFGQL